MPYTLIPAWVLIIILLWTLPWKGYALWKAAKNGQKEWFVVLFLVNTLAILEILYLKFWQKKGESCCEHEKSEKDEEAIK
ncbi:MAG: hypothetical protein HY813_02790 [Candidatus Portnoybacteria bacterium]|nr:hypothetical protein [Candidatus Portnoybacteria bacterium]